jgi:hypothetical protein
MYEFVETIKGWRVFWGPDPLPNEPQLDAEAECDEERCILLPFTSAKCVPKQCPAA